MKVIPETSLAHSVRYLGFVNPSLVTIDLKFIKNKYINTNVPLISMGTHSFIHFYLHINKSDTCVLRYMINVAEFNYSLSCSFLSRNMPKFIAYEIFVSRQHSGFMVSNANNISVISWLSVLLWRKSEYPKKTTNLSQVTDQLYHNNILH